MPLHEELLQLLTAYGDGAKEKRLGLVRLTKVPQQASEVVEAPRRIEKGAWRRASGYGE
jgi:hypothetical protein